MKTLSTELQIDTCKNPNAILLQSSAPIASKTLNVCVSIIRTVTALIAYELQQAFNIK